MAGHQLLTRKFGSRLSQEAVRAGLGFSNLFLGVMV